MSDDDDGVQHMELHLVVPVPDRDGAPIKRFTTRDAQWSVDASGMVEVHARAAEEGRVDFYTIPMTNVRCIRMLGIDLDAMRRAASAHSRAKMDALTGGTTQ
jgi:hypothetical protein